MPPPARAYRQMPKTSKQSEQEEVEESDEQPLFALDIMSGPNCPVARALRCFGWEVEAYDLAFGPEYDLRDPTLKLQILKYAAKADGFWIAMDCSTLSRAREIPILGMPEGQGPQPLRSETYPEGLLNLPDKDRIRVEEANELIRFCAEVVRTANITLAVQGLENPANAYFWLMPDIAELNNWALWTFFTKLVVCLGPGPRAKRSRLIATHWRGCDPIAIISMPRTNGNQ